VSVDGEDVGAIHELPLHSLCFGIYIFAQWAFATRYKKFLRIEIN
jgi:hypothetical protein